MEITLKHPTAEDGIAVNRLVSACPPLDPNSVYCNLLQASHFSATSVAAFMGDELVGFISGYRVPAKPETVFIWQVAVGEKARGQRLASRMLAFIVGGAGCCGVTHMDTTITEDNRASWALFEGFARDQHAPLTATVGFDRDRHFQGEHDSEVLVTIGPFGALQ